MPDLSQFRPQHKNANRHTERGMSLLDESIAQNGWIGAMTTAYDGEVIDGSARLETVYERFGDVEPIVIESDGTRPIIHKRIDIQSAADPKAIKLAIEANRIAEINLNWDASVVVEAAETVDLSGLWAEEEFESLIHHIEEPDVEPLHFDDDEPTGGSGDGARYPLAIVLSWAELQEWKVIKESLGEIKDSRAFLKLMRGGNA